MGLPVYGRSFMLLNADKNDFGAAATGPGSAGRVSWVKYTCFQVDVLIMYRSGFFD